MKKLISIAMCAVMLTVCFGVAAFAEPDAASAEVYVTIANKGRLAVSYEKVTVTDIDEDGAITINDALYAAHEAKYQSGADAGYSYYSTEQYGLSIGKLWGDESGSFGYYKNNASAWSLADTVNDGDHIYAFVYADVENWSDSYSFFNVNEVTADGQTEISLTLSAAGYDADWNPITVVVEGATVTVDGVATEVKTDADGKATIIIADEGKHVISATSETATLVPPICVATVNTIASTPEISSKAESEIPKAGDESSNIFFIVLAVASIGVISVVAVKRKSNEI